MRRLVAVIVAACAAMAGCGGGSSAEEAPQPVVTTAVPPDVVMRASAMSWPAGQHLVRSQEEWISLWSTNKGRPNLDCIFNPRPDCKRLPAYDKPDFDFAQYSLLVVFDLVFKGQSLSWGRVDVSGGVLNVEVVRRSGPSTSFDFFDTQQGVQFLLIPVSALPVKFTWRYEN